MNLLEKLIDKYDINKEFNVNHNNIELPLGDSHSNVFIKIIFNEEKNISKLNFIYRAYEWNNEDNNIRYIGNAFDNLYFILSAIYEKYKLLLTYQVNYYDSECYGCYDPDDGIEIIINIEPIYSILNDNQVLNFIDFLSTFYYDIPIYGYEVNCNIWKETIYPLKKTQNITFHKKAKNIKYFFEIIKRINNSSVSIYNANKIFEKILSKIEIGSKIGLIKYKKTKKNGYSAKPYIDTLKDFNILQIINDRYILDKTSKWFLELELFLINENYIFEKKQLNFLEKYYFLKKILTFDSQYIYELFEIIYILEKTTLTEVSKLFQEKHQEYINLDYVKGLVSLRIHWLKSLGLLAKTKEIQFTSNGLILFDEIMKIRTLYLTIPTSINAFLLLKFTYSFSKLIEIKASREKTLDILVKKYIHIVINLHINKLNKRAIISSVINSIIILSLLEKKCVIEYEDIKDIITNTNILKELGYSFVYSNKEQDGYIKRI